MCIRLVFVWKADFVIKFLTKKSVANHLSFPGREGLELLYLQHFNRKNL